MFARVLTALAVLIALVVSSMYSVPKVAAAEKQITLAYADFLYTEKYGCKVYETHVLLRYETPEEGQGYTLDRFYNGVFQIYDACNNFKLLTWVTWTGQFTQQQLEVSDSGINFLLKTIGTDQLQHTAVGVIFTLTGTVPPDKCCYSLNPNTVTFITTANMVMGLSLLPDPAVYIFVSSGSLRVDTLR